MRRSDRRAGHSTCACAAELRDKLTNGPWLVKRVEPLRGATRPAPGARSQLISELLGHKDVETTMIYTHVLNRGGDGVHSPLDRLRKAVGSESRRIIGTDRPA